MQLTVSWMGKVDHVCPSQVKSINEVWTIGLLVNRIVTVDLGFLSYPLVMLP